MSVALSIDSDESNKDEYNAEFESETVAAERDDDSLGPAGLCVDKETSCIYTNN